MNIILQDIILCHAKIIFLFKSEYSGEFIQKDNWYLFDNLQDVLFEIIGDKDKILSEFRIHTIIYKKL